MVGTAEHERQRRNLDVAGLSSGLVTFAGAVVLLVGAGLVGAVIGLAIGVAAYYLLLVSWTHNEWVYWLNQIRREMEGLDGGISLQTADRIGVQPTPGAQALVQPLPLSPEIAARAESMAAERATLRWAFANPRGRGHGRPGQGRKEETLELLQQFRRFMRRH